MRLWLAFFVGMMPVLMACAQPNRVADDRPNILLVMTDDQGWGDVGLHGNPLIDTPVMDQLAGEGAWFERFYVSSVCAPTRASLLTGRYNLRTGTQWVTRGLEGMRPEEVTLAEVLKDAGYATGLFGKWHNGAHYPMSPQGQGFDTFFGFSAGHWNNYFDTELELNGEMVDTEGFITDVLTDATLAFMEDHQNQPFFAYVPYNAPHSPFQVPDRYFEKYKARDLDDRTASAYAMVENVDDNLGRLLAKLDELGLAEHTIVLFLTDNGPNGQRYNGDMRGTKASMHEGGVRVPLFVRWPGQIAPGLLVEPLTAHIDLLPTLSDLTGVPLPGDLALDGVTLAPLLRAQTRTLPERRLFFNYAGRMTLDRYPGAVRTDRFRLVRELDGPWMLFDMRADPGQHVDVAHLYPDTLRTLSDAYERWFDDVSRDLTEGPRTIPVGYDAAPRVMLPASEGYTMGETVRYQGGMGWANDWFTGWTTTEDAIWWALDVVQAGAYEVWVEYTLPEADTGVRLRAEAGSQTAEAAIEEAFDPDFIPSPDRLDRGEVYEKPWAQAQLGTLALSEGEVRLTLTAPEIPGTQAPEIKSVRLHRVP